MDGVISNVLVWWTGVRFMLRVDYRCMNIDNINRMHRFSNYLRFYDQ